MINIEHVSKLFSAKKAVDDLCLQVPAGEFFCFLGPNGAGKTTTIKMLCGLLRPSSGSLTIDGIDVRKNPQAVHEILGYIPDSPFVYELLSVSEFYDFIGGLYKVPYERIKQEKDKSLELFGLRTHANMLIKDLSHGLRQRIIYAVTFLHKPRVFFVDEPFIGLDPHSIRLIKNMLYQKTREGATVFMTTHILALIEDLADRVGIINHGKLVALGTVEELTRQLKRNGRLEDVFLHLTAEGGGSIGTLTMDVTNGEETA